MAADFSSYGAMEQQPSVASEMFGSPLKAQWTLQKASMMMTSMNAGMWKQAMAGQGVKWSGVVGFRGIALGKEAYGGTLARASSPSHIIGGLIKSFSPEKAKAFHDFGLFGKSQSGIGASLGRFFGGGTIESSKFDPSAITKYDTQYKAKMSEYKKAMKEWQRDLKTGRANSIRHIRAAQAGKDVSAWRRSGLSSAQNAKISDALRYQVVNDDIMKEAAGRRAAYESSMMARKPTVAGMGIIKGKAAYDHAKFIRRVAKIGRVASWVGAASIAFDVGSAIGGYAMDTISSVANQLETKMSGIFNREMEFGGKVGIGFYNQSSGTERQRALSAIGRGFGGSAGMGNEAGFQHVDSTW